MSDAPAGSSPPFPADTLVAVLATAADHIALLGPDGTIAWANHGWAAFHGASFSTLVGRMLTPQEAGASEVENGCAAVKQAAGSGQTQRFEAVGRTAEGPRHMEFVVTPVSSDAPHATVVVARDVTSRRQTVAALHESEEFFRTIFAHGPIGIMTLSADRRVLRMNPRMAQLLGDPAGELGARRLEEITHPDDFARERPQLEALEAGEVSAYTIEKRLIRRDGTPVWTRATRTAIRDDDGSVRFLVSLTEDIEDRKRAAAERAAIEERLRERQKLESLGVLAGGIAHDLNNLLVPILGNAELALGELPAYAPQRGPVQEIVLAAQRAARLAQQMLAYSGRGHFVVRPVDLSQLVRDMSAVLRASAGLHVSLTFELAPGLPPVQADTGQMRQALLNLAQNAIEAVAGGGHLVVSTGTRRLTRDALESCYLPSDVPEGDYAFIRVHDTGPGIPPGKRERLFDPFFSTKGPGRGLGLPAVLGIVRGHGGAIEVSTAPASGTTITLYFPIARAGAAAAEPSRPEAEPAEPRARGTVLVIEDDEAVRALARRTLERAGYDVLVGADGPQGIEICRSNAATIDCVLLDMVMPHLGGERVARELHAVAPHAAIVLMSGYPDIAISDEVAVLATGVLQKPFTPQTLREAVRTVLMETK